MLKLEYFKAVKLHKNVNKVIGGTEVIWYQTNFHTGISYSRSVETGSTVDTRNDKP